MILDVMAGWVTVDEVLQAKAALEASMPGWRTPLAHALGIAREGELVEWRVTNYPNEHELPAVVLGKVVGHRSGSATCSLDLAAVDLAIGMLEPAGACESFEHPNLWAWQRLRAEFRTRELPSGLRIVVVFVGDALDLVTSEADRQLRSVLGIA